MGRTRAVVCNPCRLRHRKCDGGDVCQTCIMLGCSERCDGGRKEPGRPVKAKAQILPNPGNEHIRPVSIVFNDQEADLFHHWCKHIVPWHDLFDEDRHFARVVIAMARKSRLLMSAILAYATKKVYRTGPNDCEPSMVRYYNESISLLIPELAKGTDDDYLIVTAVVLCGLEMMDASCDNWQKHLSGASSLMNNIGTVSLSSLRKAAFCIFVREDTLLSIIRKTPTHLDPRTWIIDTDLERDDTQANKMLRILALVSNSLADDSNWDVQQRLSVELDEFKNGLTQKFDPIRVIPGPIPKVLYTSSIQGSMYQMYHLAYILLTRQDQRAEHHALEIIGISNSGLDMSAQLHSVQPLFYAGLMVNDPTHKQFVLSSLEQIERDTGWATKYRRDALMSKWA